MIIVAVVEVGSAVVGVVDAVAVTEVVKSDHMIIEANMAERDRITECAL